jgi:hypothetical protein
MHLKYRQSVKVDQTFLLRKWAGSKHDSLFVIKEIHEAQTIRLPRLIDLEVIIKGRDHHGTQRRIHLYISNLLAGATNECSYCSERIANYLIFTTSVIIEPAQVSYCGSYKGSTPSIIWQFPYGTILYSFSDF